MSSDTSPFQPHAPSTPLRLNTQPPNGLLRSRAHWAAPLLLFVVGSTATCSPKVPELPAGPDTIQTGLVVYEHANYEGRSALITQSIRDLSEFSGPCSKPEGGGGPDWNDCISSLRVGAGWSATVYTSNDFKGTSLTVTGDQSNLQLVPGDCNHDGMNDCISSIALVRSP